MEQTNPRLHNVVGALVVFLIILNPETVPRDMVCVERMLISPTNHLLMHELVRNHGQNLARYRML